MTKDLQRDGYSDFLKLFLIQCVVLGHFLNYWQHTHYLSSLYYIIYSFHMPLFVFISGYFSRNIDKQRIKDIDCVLFPFFLFQFLNYVYTLLIPIEPLPSNLLIPYHQNWYLLALFWWRLFLPYMNYLKPVYVLIISFGFSIIAGFIDGFNGFLAFYKTVSFAPFFCMGYCCKDFNALAIHLAKKKTSCFFLAVMVAIFIILACGYDRGIEVLNYSLKYSNGYDNEIVKLLYRMSALLLGVAMSSAVIGITKSIFDRYPIIRQMGGG